MKLPPPRHRWKITPRAAIALQKHLAGEVRSVPLPRPPRLVAGGDAAFTPNQSHIIAAWVVWDAHEHRVVDSASARRPVQFPYVPGLLSFREAPGLLAAARKLRTSPDVFMLDGQGFAHPRRFGIACHVGLLMGRPTLGCAKSLLCGSYNTPGRKRGAHAPLVHDGQPVGRALRTQDGVQPVFVSVGHLVTLEDASRIVLRCCTHFRLPEPARLAHQLVTYQRLGGTIPGGSVRG